MQSERWKMSLVFCLFLLINENEIICLKYSFILNDYVSLISSQKPLILLLF